MPSLLHSVFVDYTFPENFTISMTKTLDARHMLPDIEIDPLKVGINVENVSKALAFIVDSCDIIHKVIHSKTSKRQQNQTFVLFSIHPFIHEKRTLLC